MDYLKKLWEGEAVMEKKFPVGHWVKVKESTSGIHSGQMGKVIDDQCGKVRPLYELEFPDGMHGFFEENELQ